MAPVRIYLAPGFFGFASLAAYEYFGHVRDGLRQRFEAAGRQTEIRVCEVHPTASIRRRARKLEQMIESTAGSDDGPIHLVGHSTGGLDARLVASPSVCLDGVCTYSAPWHARIRSVTTMATPHYGTPLASFFATAQGQRLLFAVSAVTVAVLKLGTPPLTAASALVAAVGRTERATGIEVRAVDRIIDATGQLLDEAAGRHLRDWLEQIRDDQGAIIQLTPEAMDLFQAGVENRDGVLYQCVAAYTPENTLRRWLWAVRTPWAAVSAALFQLMYKVTEIQDDRYRCSAEDGSANDALFTALGELPPADANDGVVPLRSQIWGELAWVGKGDHLDIVGHFPGPDGHYDWLNSGACFDVVRFEALMDRLTHGMLRAQC